MLNKATYLLSMRVPKFKGYCGALARYQVLMRYNLQVTFSETVALLNTRS